MFGYAGEDLKRTRQPVKEMLNIKMKLFRFIEPGFNNNNDNTDNDNPGFKIGLKREGSMRAARRNGEWREREGGERSKGGGGRRVWLREGA